MLLLQVSLETTAAHVRHDVCSTALAGVGTCGTSLWLQGAHGYIGGSRFDPSTLQQSSEKPVFADVAASLQVPQGQSLGAAW